MFLGKSVIKIQKVGKTEEIASGAFALISLPSEDWLFTMTVVEITERK